MWWYAGRVIAGGQLKGFLRTSGEGFAVAATDLQNWDMLAFIHLLQSDLFSSEVRAAANDISEYTRRDLAHENLECDWQRDWSCMAKLLEALGEDVSPLRKFCNSKGHASNTGDVLPS